MARDHTARAVCLRLLVFLLPVVLGGCFVASWSLDRPAPESASGPVPYVERCEGCHGPRAGEAYTTSRHMAMGIRCGQCHAEGNHPGFTKPVRDGTCGGCHQPEFEQTVASKHFTTRIQAAFDDDRLARVALRREGFIATAAGERKFVGDAGSGELRGRLCAACHYDEHRLGLGVVQRADFCVACHAGRRDHFPAATVAATNRCVSCHVRVGESVTGQVVNSHRFAIPGTDGDGR